MTYRTTRKLELQRKLECLAEEEAALDQVAQDLEIYSKSQEAEVRLRIKGLNLVEREDTEDAKKYVDNLLQQTEKARKEKWEQRKKLGYKVLGVTAAVLSSAYIVSIPSVRTKYDSGYAAQRALEEQLKEVIDINCDGKVSVGEFIDKYRMVTGIKFYDRNLPGSWDYVSSSVDFKVDPAANLINVEDLFIGRRGHDYTITLSPKKAEQLTQEKNPCSYHVE